MGNRGKSRKESRRAKRHEPMRIGVARSGNGAVGRNAGSGSKRSGLIVKDAPGRHCGIDIDPEKYRYVECHCEIEYLGVEVRVSGRIFVDMTVRFVDGPKAGKRHSVMNLMRDGEKEPYYEHYIEAFGFPGLNPRRIDDPDVAKSIVGARFKVILHKDRNGIMHPPVFCYRVE